MIKFFNLELLYGKITEEIKDSKNRKADEAKRARRVGLVTRYLTKKIYDVRRKLKLT